jgi:hypothetical protein
MKRLSQALTGIGLLVGLIFVNASADADNISDYYKQTCRLSSGTGGEMIREQFLRMAYTTARQKRHCVIAFLKNGGYVYGADGVLLDDYTPLSRQPRNCITMDCL